MCSASSYLIALFSSFRVPRKPIIIEISTTLLGIYMVFKLCIRYLFLGYLEGIYQIFKWYLLDVYDNFQIFTIIAQIIFSKHLHDI